MISVVYTHRFGYRHDGRGEFPMLLLQVSPPDRADQTIDVDAYLDSGATLTLFNGELATAIGIELLSGRPQQHRSATGASVEARRHKVVLAHEELGRFELEISFSTSSIARNLLGRDFFNLIQVGFRERWQEFYIEAGP